MDAQEIKQLKELQDAYLSVYEAKKVDQDEDGDNDFADIRVARMVASGMSKAEAIAAVKNKEYNEDFELWVNDLLDEGYDLSDYTWDEMSEIYLDEGIGSAIKSLFGKKKEPEAQKPESRGDQLRKKYNVGPEKSDTSAKRQILDRSRARAERDERDYGDKPFQKQVANQSKAAHDKYLKAGYSKYGADLPVSSGQGGSGGSGRGSKARKRAEALNNSYDLFDYMMEYLLDEGYANTQESALVIMANMSEDWRESICEAILEYQPFKDKRKRVKSKVKEFESQKTKNPEDLGFRNARLQKRIDSMKNVLGKKNKEIRSASQQKSYDNMAKGGFKHHDDPESKYYIK